jgi:hypothetical protein
LLKILWVHKNLSDELIFAVLLPVPNLNSALKDIYLKLPLLGLTSRVADTSIDFQAGFKLFWMVYDRCISMKELSSLIFKNFI